MNETGKLKSFIRDLGIDLVGIADLKLLAGMPTGLNSFPDANSFFKSYRFAIVIGAQFGKFGDKYTGGMLSKFLENILMDVVSYLEEKKCFHLPIHTEDEFNPIDRMGLVSLKALAKTAGLGWQGRSLLIVSPKHGPLHRLAAVLTDLDLQPDQPVENRCGDCSLCVDNCPTQALKLVKFNDHPQQREDVLNIPKCLGDNGCMSCIKSCPWIKTTA
jgi:epoxyqueuosine reductase